MDKFIFNDYDFIIGANYFASHAGTDMWAKWDENAVEADFRIMSEYGVEYLRVFPIWRDFQPICSHYLSGVKSSPAEIMLGEDPLPDTPEGKAGVSTEMFEHFDVFCELAQKYGIKLIIGLLTGFMSERRLVPPALNDRNIYTDPLALKWTVKYVKYFVERYKNSPCVAGWDFGNEVCWLDDAGSPERAYAWGNLIANTIRSIDGVHPIVSGLDWTYSEYGNWRTDDVADTVDIMTVHPYSCFGFAQGDPINTLRNEHYAAAVAKWIKGISQKPTFVEETGSIGYSVLNERTEGEFLNTMLFDVWAHNCGGLQWWCAFDQGELSQNPYRWNGRGSDYGLFAFDRRVKPVAEVTKKFYDFIRSLPFRKLSEHLKDCICILPHGVGGNERELVAQMDCFAIQAGLSIDYRFADQPIDDAPMYIVPCIANAHYIYKNRFVDLLEKVKNGADLYISMENCYLRWFPEVTGLNVAQRKAYTGSGEISLLGKTVKTFANYEYICDSIDGEVIAQNENGNPVFVCHKYGNGRVFSLLAPFENRTMRSSGICDSNEYLIYKYLRENVKTAKIAKCDNKYVGLTEHIEDENTRILVAVNFNTEPCDCRLELAAGWHTDKAFWGDCVENTLVMKPNDAVVVAVKK